jgi:hypothetical protein
MMKIKLTILAILASMYGIVGTDGMVRAISWLFFVGLFMALVAQLEKHYAD